MAAIRISTKILFGFGESAVQSFMHTYLLEAYNIYGIFDARKIVGLRLEKGKERKKETASILITIFNNVFWIVYTFWCLNFMDGKKRSILIAITGCRCLKQLKFHCDLQILWLCFYWFLMFTLFFSFSDSPPPPYSLFAMERLKPEGMF